jgi:hypothetical protein
LTVPSPLPALPFVMVIHEALSEADQSHPLAAVTVTLPGPPPAARFCDVGATLNVHPTPLWVTVTVLPATVNVPVRDVVNVLAAIE